MQQERHRIRADIVAIYDLAKRFLIAEIKLITFSGLIFFLTFVSTIFYFRNDLIKKENIIRRKIASYSYEIITTF